MGGAVNNITDGLGLTDYEGGIDATREGGQAALRGQQEALEWLQKIDELPRQYREDAMKQLADVYGFGDPNAKADYYGGLTDDPYYKMMAQGADEAYLRNQSATGDLRGGGSIMGVADLENKIRMATHQNNMGGIQSMLNLPDYTSDIYGGKVGIGNQQGMNIMNVGKAKSDAAAAGFSNLVGIGSMMMGLPPMGGMFGGGGGGGGGYDPNWSPRASSMTPSW